MPQAGQQSRAQPGCGDGPHHAHNHAGWQGIGVLLDNHHNQLTSATGPDGLELRREYDEVGRLIQETAPDGDITRYRYDNPQ
ncbi:RHS repeat protein [Escherichia coli]|nr:RHS repeat protein [Escherichia coli]